MSKKLIFNLFDKKSKSYMPSPMTTSTVDEIVRQLQTEAKKGDTMYALFPKDFNLCIVGEYDQSTGDIDIYPDDSEKRVVHNLGTFIPTPKESEEILQAAAAE